MVGGKRTPIHIMKNWHGSRRLRNTFFCFIKSILKHWEYEIELGTKEIQELAESPGRGKFFVTPLSFSSVTPL
jgi:hypothetical protein